MSAELDLLDALKHHVGQMDQSAGQPRWGKLVSYDPNTVTGTVEFHPGDQPSGALPIATLSVGNGWGLMAPPSPGQQVLVIPDNGHAEHGIIIGCTYSVANTPPQVPAAPGGSNTLIQAGEMALVHASGAVFRMCADGTIYSRGPWKHEGSFDVTGAMTATGNVTAGEGGGSSVELLGHIHQNSGGSGLGGPPQPGS